MSPWRLSLASLVVSRTTSQRQLTTTSQRRMTPLIPPSLMTPATTTTISHAVDLQPDPRSDLRQPRQRAPTSPAHRPGVVRLVTSLALVAEAGAEAGVVRPQRAAVLRLAVEVDRRLPHTVDGSVVITHLVVTASTDNEVNGRCVVAAVVAQPLI